MASRAGRIRYSAALVTAVIVAACGGGQGSSGPNQDAPLAIQATSGNNQTGALGGDLPVPVRIVARRGGVPAAGAVVVWSATGTGALMTPSIDTTGADGVSTSVWHLGTDPGQQSAQAMLLGGGAAPAAFTATAVDPDNVPAGATIQLRSAGGNRFTPADVVITAGATVTWTWVDGFHNVIHQDVPGANHFSTSGAAGDPPRTYSFRFTTPGIYDYYCEIHGTLTTGMHGTIEVR
jgi:plastocyanin